MKIMTIVMQSGVIGKIGKQNVKKNQVTFRIQHFFQVTSVDP